MVKTWNWIKRNKLAVALLMVVVWMSLKLLKSELLGVNVTSMSVAPSYGRVMDSVSLGIPKSERKIVTNTSVSLLVKDVKMAADQITNKAEEMGGFMVNRDANFPEEGATGLVVVRVPVLKIKEFLIEVKKTGVKVIYENVTGTDVTDQYRDLEARLTTLRKNKTTFERIMGQAETVDEILRVQNSIFGLQDQIDSLVGQQKYLEQVSVTALVSVNLATDELALPYAPDNGWRPQIIFKQAVRSLVVMLRSAGSALIWISVYSVLWLPVVGMLWWIKRKK